MLFRFCHQYQNYFSQNNSEELILFAFSFHIIRWYIAATILRTLLSVLVRSLGFVAVCAGDSQPMDVCSVHHNNSFLRYSVSLLGYGFYGDVLTDSERKRWMGPARYDLSGSSLGHWKGNLPPFIATFNTVPATLELRVGKKEMRLIASLPSESESQPYLKCPLIFFLLWIILTKTTTYTNVDRQLQWSKCTLVDWC